MTLPNYTMNDQIQQLEIQYLKTRIAQLEVERDYLKENVGMLVEETFSLESMLDAIGAGGVGQSIRPPVQMDTAPAAWAILSDDGTAIRLWSKDKATAQEAADKYGRPLVPLYTAPQPTRQPLPADTYTALAHRIATRFTYSTDRSFCEYYFAIHTLEQFVRAIEQAHGITGGQ